MRMTIDGTQVCRDVLGDDLSRSDFETLSSILFVSELNTITQHLPASMLDTTMECSHL